jgi:hypothetical protein
LPLSLGQGKGSVSQPPAVSRLWWFTVCFSIFQDHFSLAVAHWFKRWSLWYATWPTSSRGLSTTCCWPSYHLLAPPPFSGGLSEFPTTLLCVSFQFLVYSSCLFYSGQGEGVSLTRGQCWFIPRMAGEIPHDTWLSLFGLPNVSQVDLWLWLAAAGGFWISQCKEE